MKSLSEMSLEELWQLFPIVLTEHQSDWADWYHDEVTWLKTILPHDVVFYHVGSTAVKGIWAKPIIDVLVVVDENQKMEQVAKLLQASGYTVMADSNQRISLNKGYTIKGFAEKVFHLHLRLKDDIDEVYFRDYLNAHPDTAQAYETLKLQLWKKFEHNRDAYTDAKTEFVKEVTRLAKEHLV